MKRTVAIFVVLTLVVGSVAAVPALAAQSSADARASTEADATSATRANNSSGESIPPGARLSGAVGTHGAEIDSEVESRAFGLKVAKAETDDAKAEAVAEQFNQSERRADELDERLEELKQARENGSISRGQYAARVATMQAELHSVQRMADETARVSETLPRDKLEANGVNVTAIETLRRNAANRSGPEVAAIAQDIAGPPVRQQPTPVADLPRDSAAGNATVPTDRATGNRTSAGNHTVDGPDTINRTEISVSNGSLGGSNDTNVSVGVGQE